MSEAAVIAASENGRERSLEKYCVQGQRMSFLVLDSETN